jgi:hypothetical protein
MSRSTARAPDESWVGEEDKGTRGALRILVVVGAALLVLGVALAIRGRSDNRSRKVGDIIERTYPGAAVGRCRSADGSPLGSGVMTCVIGHTTPQLRHDLVRYSGAERPPTDRLCLVYVDGQVSLFGYAARRGNAPCAGSSR